MISTTFNLFTPILILTSLVYFILFLRVKIHELNNLKEIYAIITVEEAGGKHLKRLKPDFKSFFKFVIKFYFLFEL